MSLKELEDFIQEQAPRFSLLAAFFTNDDYTPVSICEDEIDEDEDFSLTRVLKVEDLFQRWDSS